MGSRMGSGRACALVIALALGGACSKDDAQSGPAAGSPTGMAAAAGAGGDGVAGIGGPVAGGAGSPTGNAGASGSAAGEAGTPSGGDGAPAASGAGGGNAGEAGASGSVAEAGASGTDSGNGGAGAANGTGPGDWGPGDYPPGLTELTYLEISGVDGQAGNTRQYKVHVPPSYDPDLPMPLVFCIHGLAQDPIMFCVNGAHWNETADDAGFILVMPFGYQNSWNAGTCCGGASAAQLDEVALFRALFDEVGSHLNVDLDRVYATGLSNGAYMSYRLACEAADLFTAVAPGAGAIGKNDIGGGTNPASDFTVCEPSQPISVLDIHGTADFLVPYTLQAPSLARMAEVAGCSTDTMQASDPPSGGDTTCVSYGGCQDGIEITGCSVEGGGHCWFGSEDCGTGGGAIGAAIVGANSDTMQNNAAIVDFFNRHAR